VAARVRAVLRRSRSDGDEAGEPGAPLAGPRGLRVDLRTRRASIGPPGGELLELSLSRTEFDLLAALLREPGRVFERQDLLERVWGQDVVVGERTVDVHVKALRRKLEEAAGAGALVETVRGVGYRLREE
jgi:DNA-binding response OmpR family regulator